ncbi:hypothetical protein CRENBAI_011552 [Crenichthys baileyi]|uniref:Uncharacterized protein n=1 Tax=Crenichthys baileyi TaxID=28760 RepID=A0AAV9SEF8_9TELE
MRSFCKKDFIRIQIGVPFLVPFRHHTFTYSQNGSIICVHQEEKIIPEKTHQKDDVCGRFEREEERKPSTRTGAEPQEKGSKGSHHSAPKTGHPTNPTPQTGRGLSMPATHTPAWHTPATLSRLASFSTKAKSYPQLPCSVETHLPEPGGHTRQRTGHRN